jgi:GNAT superfamily N-acetyltransferase
MLTCAQIWSDSIAEYVGRLNQPWFAGDFEPLRRLLLHFVTQDPTRFVVAVAADEPARVVGFGSANLRGSVWFLGMLFVLPPFQGAGVGRVMLDAILPPLAERGPHGITLGTATDSVQPISNALYSLYGMVPRVPAFNLVGRPARRDALPGSPAGVRMHETAWADETAIAREATEIDVIDGALLGFAHPNDHAFLRSEGRRRFLARSESGQLLGYGYAAPSGRIGPIAAVDATLLAPVTAHMIRTVPAPGAYATWIPGSADELFVALLRAGLRIESFPALFLWDRPIADFSRYVPINLALL